MRRLELFVLVVAAKDILPPGNYYEGYQGPWVSDQCGLEDWRNTAPATKRKPYGCETIRLEDIESAEQFYQDYVRKRKPVRIITGSLEKLNWDVKTLSLEGLRRAFRSDEEKVIVQSIGQVNMFGQYSPKFPLSFPLFLEALRIFEEGDKIYYLSLQNYNGRALGPPLSRISKAFSVPHFFTTLPIYTINMWLGNSGKGGSSSELHEDGKDNLYVLVKGRKRFRFYSPNQAYNLYLYGKVYRVQPDGNIMYDNRVKTKFEKHFSRINPDEPDYKAFPLYRNADWGECDLQEGDIFYLPHGWFHHVTSYDFNLAINFWGRYQKDYDDLED